MLTQGPIKQEVDIEVSSAVLDSHQGYAKSLFDSYIADMLKGLDEKAAEKALTELFWNSVVNINITYVEMLNKVNLAQVFLWF